VLLNVEDGVAVFALLASNDVLLVAVPCDLLETVADTEDWDTHLEDSGVDVGRVIRVDRVGTAGKDNTLGLEGELRDLLGARKHLGVDAQLAQTAGDQMSVLRSEVEHQDGVEEGVGRRRDIGG
jgi:hypothetical protein